MTTDPLVSHPSFGQSWNPYSYVLNNPLAYTDPSGFEDAPQPTVTVHRDGLTTVTMFGPPTAQQAAQDRANNEALRDAPIDLKATGKQAASAPQALADAGTSGMASRANHARRPSSFTGFDPTFGKSSTEIAGEVAKGAASGLAELAGDATKIDILRIPSGLATLVGTAWRSGGALGGLSALFWEPGRRQVDEVVARAIEGDFEGAGAAGVKALAAGVAAGVAIGELGGAAADAVGEGQKGTRVTGDALKAARQEFNAIKPKFWKREAAANMHAYSSEQIADMAKGNAPIGADGYRMELHHKTPLAEGGTNSFDNFNPMTRTDHRLGPNYKSNHPNLP